MKRVENERIFVGDKQKLTKTLVKVYCNCDFHTYDASHVAVLLPWTHQPSQLTTSKESQIWHCTSSGNVKCVI